MSFKEFKESHRGGYILIAGENIPGFYQKGDSMYGDCDRMTVADWQPLGAGYTVFLAEGGAGND
jgi:hypothetical protein